MEKIKLPSVYYCVKNIYPKKVETDGEESVVLMMEATAVRDGNTRIIPLTPELRAKLVAAQYKRLSNKHLTFTFSKDGVATDVVIEDSPEEKARKRTRTSVSTSRELVVMDLGSGKFRVKSMPEDYDFSVAEGLARSLGKPDSEDPSKKGVDFLKIKEVYKNHRLMRIVDEGDGKLYVFQPVMV